MRFCVIVRFTLGIIGEDVVLIYGIFNSDIMEYNNNNNNNRIFVEY